MEKKTIGSFLTALRKANGLTQRQLAEKLNVSDKAVSRWERDECAPDLSLIPVLAEIYGVTSDEILRGQRINTSGSVNEFDHGRTEKQRNRLLTSTQTKFRIRSMIAGAIAVVGMIVACICNFELGEANIGFMSATIFYIAAILCQISFLILGCTAISDEEFRSVATSNCKDSMLLLTEIVISCTILLFTSTLPMAGASHARVDAMVCLLAGIKNTFIAASLCFVGCLIVNIVLKQHKKSTRSKLRFRCAGILSIMLILLVLIHTGLNHYLLSNRHVYAPCEEFTTLEAFQEYMQTPKDPNGYTVDVEKHTTSKGETAYRFINYFNEEECLRTSTEVEKCLFKAKTPKKYGYGVKVIPTPNYFTAEYGYYFEHLNLNVAHYEVSNNDDLIPIYTFTTEQFEHANSIAFKISLGYTVLYAISIAAVMIFYYKKRNNLP